MAQNPDNIIDVGDSANDGTGDQIRDAFIKINTDFNEVFTGQASVAREYTPATSAGEPGDVAGTVAYDDTYVYVCFTTYEDAASPGTTPIWHRITGTWS